jgi:hypothetical protein
LVDQEVLEEVANPFQEGQGEAEEKLDKRVFLMVEEVSWLVELAFPFVVMAWKLAEVVASHSLLGIQPYCHSSSLKEGPFTFWFLQLSQS